ncbi:serine hydrolase domain-containing protein [Nocardia bovistercoris]|uniref:Beta-lactamase family protein n=1 Tax=Nocardia bovistercoris TaxID=2785916 RepID=A0A931N5P8_9NOCA|nr:serine hydrolase domain-containing protein [Nocardia bovistercoris]MBH0779631.1 beta-lactamase family protein [Nocardia bovistercoris]
MDSEFHSRLWARVADLRAEAGIPSLLAAVGKHGVVAAVAAVGQADVENRVPATGESVYRVGAITKSFTAAVTLLLAEGGELGLDEPIDRHLPGTPFGRVSPRMLLSHTAGLPREAPTDMWETMRGPSSAALREAFARVEFVAEPGRRWHYSNLGYAVLGQVIRAVAGRSCESVIDDMLLRPLGLNSTSWSAPDGAVVGYRLDPFVARVHREPVLDQGAIGVAGQMWSTATDLLRWGYALAGREPAVLPVGVVEQMHATHTMVDTSGWTRGWGLGLALRRHDHGIVAGHTGALPGFRSALAVDRDTGMSVAVMANVTGGIETDAVATEILAEVLREQPAQTPVEWFPALCPPHIEPMLGVWWSEAGETILRWEIDGLHARLATDPETSDTRFTEAEPGRFRAVAGRLRGELLLVTHADDGIELHWATYPLTRTPRGAER